MLHNFSALQRAVVVATWLFQIRALQGKNMFFSCGSSKARQREVTTPVGISPYVPIIILCARLAYTDLVVDATTLAVAEKMKVCGNANVQDSF